MRHSNLARNTPYDSVRKQRKKPFPASYPVTAQTLKFLCIIVIIKASYWQWKFKKTERWRNWYRGAKFTSGKSFSIICIGSRLMYKRTCTAQAHSNASNTDSRFAKREIFQFAVGASKGLVESPASQLHLKNYLLKKYNFLKSWSWHFLLFLENRNNNFQDNEMIQRIFHTIVGNSNRKYSIHYVYVLQIT